MQTSSNQEHNEPGSYGTRGATSGVAAELADGEVRMPGISVGEVWDMLARNLRFILGSACLGFALVAALTLGATMEFRSSGRLYLGELDEKAHAVAASSSGLDLSGGEQGDLGSEIEILRSRTLIAQAILDSGLNVELRPAGWKAPRYLSWRLAHRDPKLLDVAAQHVRAVATKLSDAARESRELKVHFTNTQDYEVWDEGTRLGKGKLGEPLKLGELTLQLVPGDLGAPLAGSWYELEVSPLEEQVDDALKALNVSLPKPVNQGDPPRVVSLEFVHKSPRLAAGFLRELMSKYLKERQGWKTEDASAAEAFVSEQLASMRRSLESTEQKLADYRANAGVIVLDNEAKAMIEQMGKYEEQRVAARLEVAALADTKRALSNPDLPLEAYLLGESTDSVLANLARTLSEARSELSDLEGRFQPAAPDVKKQRAQVEAHLSTIRSYVSTRLERARENLASIGQVIAQFEQKLKGVPGAELGLAQLGRETEVYSRMYSYLLERQQQAAMVKASTVSKNRVLDPPLLPYREHSPSLPVRLAASLFGVLLGALLVVLRRVCASTFQSAAEVRAALAPLPILGVVPARPRTGFFGAHAGSSPLDALLGEPQGAYAESFRTLRTNLYALSRGGRVVVFTSPGTADGKTTCLLSLAAMLAADQKNVLVIDAHLRRPTHELLTATGNDEGLRGVLSGQCAWREVTHTVPLSWGTIYSIGAGRGGTAELLSGKRMEALLGELRATFDFVLLDAPSFPESSDALILSSQVDCVISVLRLENTVRNRTLEHLRGLGSGSHAHGLIVNAAGSTRPFKAPSGPSQRHKRRGVPAVRAVGATLFVLGAVLGFSFLPGAGEPRTNGAAWLVDRALAGAATWAARSGLPEVVQPAIHALRAVQPAGKPTAARRPEAPPREAQADRAATGAVAAENEGQAAALLPLNSH